MINPLNYFAHAKPDIEKQLELARAEGTKVEYTFLRLIFDEASRCPKFILPPYGRYAGIDLFEGVMPDTLALPYDVTVCEFAAPVFKDMRPGKTASTKRMLLAVNMGENGIGILPLSWIDNLGMWILSHTLTLLRLGEADGAEVKHFMPLVNDDGVTLKTTAGRPLLMAVAPVVLSLTKSIAEKQGVTVDHSMMVGGNDSMEEVEALLQLLTMLSMVNVGTTDIAPSAALNKKRMKHGKQPFYTYKVLTIVKHGQRQHADGGTHASPRLHWRRGHVRHYQSGKNAYVRPHMVGDASKGSVSKDYLLSE